jgi:FMN reductase
MPSIVVLAGSPSVTACTAAVLDLLALRLTGHGHDVRVVPIRELPPGPLLAADAHHPAISDVVKAIAAARGLIVASPVYKTAYTGLLEALLDLLPQDALAGKTVLPLAIGSSPAHMLALDYALRPVLASMGAHVGQGYFMLDQLINLGCGTGPILAPAVERPLLSIVDAFSEAVASFRPVTVTSTALFA